MMGKIITFTAALLMSVCSALAAEPVGYEWWFDNDLTTVGTGTVTGTKVELSPDVSELTKGLHHFNLRMHTADSVWGAPYRKMFFTTDSTSVATAYEYWLDNDHDAKTVGEIASGSKGFDVTLDSVPRGLHYFNCRLYSNNVGWGAPYRKMVFTTDSTSVATAYEYWLDNDHDAKTVGEIASGSKGFGVTLDSVPRGLHYFNCRLYSNNVGWGAPYRKMVFTTDTVADATAYEYWIDNSYDKKVTGDITGGAGAYVVSLEGVRKGLHRFNYRLRNGAGEWGSVYSDYFYYSTAGTPFTVYEYWLDDDYANRKSETTGTNPVNFSIDLTGFDKSGDVHYFNLRVRDDDGEWSSFYRKLIVFYKEGDNVPMIGYRHYLNGDDLGYVEVSDTVSGKRTFSVDLPEGVGINMAEAAVKFNGDEVYVEGNDSVHYSLQIRTELGWAPPVDYDVEVSGNFSTTAEVMTVPSSILFARPSAAEFKAVKFTTDGRTLYLRTDRRASMDIYRDGAKVISIPPEKLVATKKVELEAGTYFGVIYGVEEGDGDVAFHLMDTNNQVPTPVIDFSGGKVTITCSRSDAQIYYTLDDSRPTTESTLYTEPFTLDHNAVVKSVAVIPGSDFEPSAIAELVVDSYKVANPVITFSNLTLVITQDVLPEVRTYYTLDGSEPTEESEQYGAPFTLSGNVKVRARSFKDGYNPSDIVEFNYVHAVYVTAAPVITADGNVVTLTAQTEGSELYYGIDESDPALMTQYDSPIEMTVNGTVYAQARKAGMYDSDVVSYNIDANKVSDPTIGFENLKIVITQDGTAGVSTYYTLDGSEPTETGTLYEEPFSVSDGQTVKARSFKEGYNPSETVSYTFVRAEHEVQSPTFEVTGKTVVLKAQTEGSELYYGIDESDPALMTQYDSPIEMTVNGTVYAQARKAGMYDSEVVSETISEFKCRDVSVEYNGRYMTLTAEEEDAEIRYSLDGGDPETVYSGSFDVGGIHTLRAVVLKAGYEDSDVIEYSIPAYGDERHAETTADGLLAKCYEWADSTLLREMTAFEVKGYLAADDYAVIRTMRSMRHLNLKEVVSEMVPDSAFAGMSLISVSMPAGAAQYGSGLFSGNTRLCSVVCNGTAGIGADFADGASNPNLLLYVANPAETPVEGAPARNIVAGGAAESIALADGYPFYAVEEFNAGEISYTRNFSCETAIDGCSGWETLTLPFDVATVSDATGAVAPFASEAEDCRKFWLYEPSGTGWERTAGIRANRPYIVAMPNHPDYADESIIKGDVTFSAQNAFVASTPEEEAFPYIDGAEMFGTYQPHAADDGLYVLNEEAYEGFKAGSVFVRGLRDVRPFECYLTSPSQARYMPVFDTSDIDMLMAESGIRIWSEGHDIYIRSGLGMRVRIFDVTGRLLRIVDVKAGETTRVEDFNAGIYIAGHTKIYVKG